MTMIPITVKNPDTGEDQMSQMSIYDIMQNPAAYVSEEYVLKLCQLVDQMEGDRQRVDETQKTADSFNTTYWQQIQNLRAEVAAINKNKLDLLQWLETDEVITLLLDTIQQEGVPPDTGLRVAFDAIRQKASAILQADLSHSTTACYSVRDSEPDWERFYSVLADAVDTVLSGSCNRMNMIGISQFIKKPGNVLKLKRLRNLFNDLKVPSES